MSNEYCKKVAIQATNYVSVTAPVTQKEIYMMQNYNFWEVSSICK